MAKYDESDGVWRTVGGRRIFIKDGQSLSDAMKESGKFKKTSKGVESKTEKNREYLKRDAEKLKNDQWIWAKEGWSDSYLKEVKSSTEEESKEKDYGNTGLTKKEKETAHNEGEARAYYSKQSKEDIAKDLEERKNRLNNDYYNEKDRAKYQSFYDEGKKFYDEKYGKEASIKSQQSDIEKASGLKVEKAFETDAFGTGKEDRFMLEDGRWISHSTETLGSKDDTWSINKFENGSIESEDYKSYDEMIKHLGENNKLNAKRIAEKDIKEKGYEYYSRHGLGPGTLPKDVNTGGTGEEENGWTKFKTDRPLTEKELNKYDIQSETKNHQIKINNKISNSDKYAEYYKKEQLGEPKTFNKGDKVLVQDSYSGKFNAEYIVVREATDDDKRFDINKNLKGYVLKDKDGNEIVKADIRLKPVESSSGNVAYKKAFEEYKKKHPNSKLDLNKFVKMSEGK